jgi:hypothetical protein
LQISAFFSKAKTANIIGLVLLFGTVFPYIAISSDSVSYSMKTLAAILPSTAFALSLTQMSNLESNGIGSTTINYTHRFRNFSLETGLIMLACMSLLFLLLAFYVDLVVPSEFGLCCFCSCMSWNFFHLLCLHRRTFAPAVLCEILPLAPLQALPPSVAHNSV